MIGLLRKGLAVFPEGAVHSSGSCSLTWRKKKNILSVSCMIHDVRTLQEAGKLLKCIWHTLCCQYFIVKGLNYSH